MPVTDPILRVAVPSPLRRLFDYLPPRSNVHPPLQPGQRVSVSFGRQRCQGLIVELASRSEFPVGQLKAVSAVLDESPLIPADLLQVLCWAADYYQHPIGEVIQGALPVLLRQGRPALATGEEVWSITPTGQALAQDALRRAPRQAALLAMLKAASKPLTAADIDAQHANWRPILRKLEDKAWVSRYMRSGFTPADQALIPAPALNPAQTQAVASVRESLGRFGVALVDGVTGSGKTEVYLALIEAVLARQEQALVLVPEIGLTPQLVARFRQRFAVPIAVLHSGLSDSERLNAWLAARDGEAGIVIGTRSAVFTPLARPGLMILDEEHDVSFKQQDGFRYSARDVCIKRAQLANAPVILGSATPSLESLHNALSAKYRYLQLPERAGAARPPAVAVLDIRKQPMHSGLSAALLNAMRRHLQNDGQVLLFLNRRGFAPALLCHDCGWVAPCRRCDALMTLYTERGRQRLRCHHCGAERVVEEQCPECECVELRPVGVGTERLETALQAEFPDTGIVRIDRDTTRRKGAMQSLLDSVHDGSKRILVGTQMLAKGHHFPDVTLVALVDVDQGLFSADFRGTERMAQLIVQVAGRAGRADKPGQVLIQTHHPDNPLLQHLLVEGYAGFARAALDERCQTQLPPFSYLALLRAEAVNEKLPLEFLSRARELAQQLGLQGIQLLGPIPAPMERRAGRVRAQLLIQASQRSHLHRLLTPWLQQLEQDKLGRKVRWSIDVDPQEMF